MKNTPNQETLIKVDENSAIFQKSKESAKQPGKSLKKLTARFPSTVSYSVTDYGAIMGTAMMGVNFLKDLEGTKRLRLTDSLQKMIYSYEFSQDPWKRRFLSSLEINETNSSNSHFAQPISKLYLNAIGDKYFEEGKIRSTLRLLQSKREEIFNEIFMGFRFSFGPKSTPTFVEMNISPFPEKGPGFIIAF